MATINNKVPLKEKIGYALGDGAANIAWKGVATFLFVFYTDVFGLDPVTVGVLMLVARLSDGISDVVMGIIGDRTKSKYGRFRPWILWTAIPLAVILSLLFTSPDFNSTGKIIYAYVTYILFTLIYTANNIPYGALMAVMTGDDKERTSLGSFRMVGAYAGGLIVSGALLFLVAYFGNVNLTVEINQIDDQKYEVSVSSASDVESVNIKTDNGIAMFSWNDAQMMQEDAAESHSKSFPMEANKIYNFIVTGESGIAEDAISIIDQKQGYSNAIYVMSFFLALFMIITFYTTKERVQPPKEQKTNLKQDFKDLINNRPWLILLVTGLLFNVFNSVKQGIVIIYFTHYVNNQLLAATYLVFILIAAIIGAIVTAPLGNKYGKRRLFIFALLMSGVFNALIFFCNPENIGAIFVLGVISEFFAAIFPTLFFVMLGDAADFSEFINGRRATGLVYSAGSFATKFGGGIAGAIIGMVLGMYNYNGMDVNSIQGAIPGIKMLMSWVPTICAGLAAVAMILYPLNQNRMDEITTELNSRRLKEGTN
tara:strand:- start:14332 stop:15948 length:1617 start_codon:yes stop_codon:yes gene_type:complete